MDKPKIIQFPRIEDARGNLSFFEEDNQIPFKVKRSYWIYDVPGGQIRGGHAFKEQQELIIALSGSFEVVLDDGYNKRSFQLNRSYYGLYIPCKLWRQMENFSTNSIALVLSSTYYNNADYIHVYLEFLKYIRKNEK